MADATARALPPGLADRISRLKLTARRAVEGLLSGAHRSPRFGASVEFNEHKQYVPGDDIRHLDWRVAAKSDRYYVKRFENEAQLSALLVVDASGSMGYASAGLSKLDFASQCALALAYLLLRQSDAVGLLCRAGGAWRYLAPSSQWTQFDLIAGVLGPLSPEGQFPAESLPGEILRQAPRASLCAVMSDFFWDEEQAFSALKTLCIRKKEVAVIHTLDPDELTFPFRLRTKFKDMEMTREITAEPLAVRESYLALMGEFLERFKRSCHQNELDYLRCDTSEPLEKHLLSLINLQGNRRQ